MALDPVNPIVGGVILRIPAIQSPNYVPGVSGWAIFQNGSVEFNNGTFRGTVTAATIIGSTIENSASNPKTSINPDGTIKITNASGQVIFQIAADGTVTWFSAAGAQLMQISPTGFISITEPSLIKFPSGASFEQGIAEIFTNVGGTIPAQFISMEISSASTTTVGAHDSVVMTLNSAADDNSSSANLDFIYLGSNGTPHEYAFMDTTGFNILAGAIVAVDPGSAPATPAAWHTIALQNSYTAGTNNGFTDVPQIRLMADNKNLQFKGTLVSPGGAPSQIWGLLPASFPNANLGGIFGMGLISNLTGGTVNHLRVQNNSNLSLQNATAGITYDISCIVATQ